jgi:hypothetical protein
MRPSWLADMPFLLAAIRWKAAAHLCSGMCDRSITMPTVTLNGSRQALHWNRPGRWLLPSIRVTLSASPQRGQTGPFGQRMPSK